MKKPKKTAAPKITVEIIESERGWGRKVESTREFSTRAAAEKFVAKFNAPNVKNWNKTNEVPDWYMTARIAE